LLSACFCLVTRGFAQQCIEETHSTHDRFGKHRTCHRVYHNVPFRGLWRWYQICTL